ncbi:MAG TPA: barstar family protein [Micromonosporaceae bacterium]
MILGDVTSGELPPGRYRLGRSATVRALRDELVDAGWLMRIVDGAAMTDRASLFSEFMVACDFPDWFGGNWDAFADCLKDLSWLPDEPLAILWQRSGAFEAAAPAIWRTANRVISTAIAARIDTGLPPLYLIYPYDPSRRSDPGDGIIDSDS